VLCSPTFASTYSRIFIVSLGIKVISNLIFPSGELVWIAEVFADLRGRKLTFLFPTYIQFSLATLLQALSLIKFGFSVQSALFSVAIYLIFSRTYSGLSYDGCFQVPPLLSARCTMSASLS
jgi:hypothetical protein